MTITRTTRIALTTLSLVLALMATLVPTGASADEISLVAFRNSVGICQHPLHQCNFDGGGFSYSTAALAVAGVMPGEELSVDGFTFTWPDTDPGAPDNVEMKGQLVPVLPGDATRIGFLGASHNGPVTADVTLHYTRVGADGELEQVEVVEPLRFSDWTLNANGRQPEAGNTTVVETRFRVNGTTVEQVRTFVFAASIDIDPTMTLQTIELDNEDKTHLFGLALA